MSQYTLRFLASQAAPGIVFTPAVDPNPMTPGNFAGWSSDSFRSTDEVSLERLEADGGHWVGTVHLLPDGVINMVASYFPVKGSADNIQLSGPIMSQAGESAIAIVGGGGKFAGARGEARCSLRMSDQDTPLYAYELSFEA